MTQAATFDVIGWRRAFLATLQAEDAARECFDASQRERIAGYVQALASCNTYPLSLPDDAYLEGLRVHAQTFAALDDADEGSADALSAMARGEVAATIDPVLASLGLPGVSECMSAAEAIGFLEALDKRCGVYDEAQRERLAEIAEAGGVSADDRSALAFLSGLRSQGVILAVMQAGQQ